MFILFSYLTKQDTVPLTFGIKDTQAETHTNRMSYKSMKRPLSSLINIEMYIEMSY